MRVSREIFLKASGELYSTDDTNKFVPKGSMEQHQQTVSAEVPDWSREKPRRLWDPSRRFLCAIRGYQRHTGNGPLAAICRKYWTLQHRFWTIVTQAEIDLKCEIGGGLLIPHPNGIVIHPNVKIGPNCLIFQQVTIGGRNTRGVP